jgi:hypothetical protein
MLPSPGSVRSFLAAPFRRFGATRLLTNEGMLKILCPDVEVLLVDVCSNSLNNAFVNCKRRSDVNHAT